MSKLETCQSCGAASIFWDSRNLQRRNEMTDAELIRKLLELAGCSSIAEGDRETILAGLNRIEALRSRLSQYEPVDG